MIKNYFLKTLLVFLVFAFFSYICFSQNDSAQTNLSFDFGITRGRNINLWPILKKYKNEDKKELQILFPVFSKTINYKLQTKHLHVLPLTILDSNSTGTDRRFLSFFYPSVLRFQKQTISGEPIKSFKFLELAPNISCLSISRSPKGLLVENNIFFFIWYKKNLQLNKTRFVVFPAYWYFSNKYDTIHFFFPLFYHKSGLNYKKMNVGLLYNYKKAEKEKRNILFPLWWKKEKYFKNDTLRKNTFFPLYWSVKNNEKNNKVLFPIVYSFKNRDYSSLTVLPFFSAGNSPDFSRRHLALFPFYWQCKTNEMVKNVFFPLLWSKKRFLKNDTVASTILFPFYWSLKSKDENSMALFPFLYSFKNSGYRSLTFLPFFSFGYSPDFSRKHFELVQLYWHFKTKETENRILFPLWWSNRKFFDNDTMKMDVFFPLYWSFESIDKNNKTFFPLVYKLKNDHRKSFTIVPFFSSRENLINGNKFYAISPLFWHFEKKNKKKDVFFPLYWSSSRYYKTDTVNKTTFFPFYWSIKSKEKNNKVLFPLVYSLKDSTYTSLTVFPLFSVGHSPDFTEKHFNLFPLLWNVKTKESNSSILFPFWWSNKKYFQNDTITHKTFFPFYWSVKSKEKNNDIFFPLIYKIKKPHQKSFTFFPLFSTGQNFESKNKYLAITPFFWHLDKPGKKKNIFFPIFYNSKTYSNNDTIRKNFFFPLFWSLKMAEKNQKVFFPLLYSFKDREYQSLTVFPIFSAGHSSDFSEKHFGLFPFYRHSKANEYVSTALFPFWYNSKKYFKDDTITRKTFFPLYWSGSNKEKSHQVFFPFIYKIKNPQRKSFTFFPLFSSGENLLSGNKYSAITPIFWHIEKENETKNILFPLLWNSTIYSDYDTVKKTIFFPLYWSVKNKFKNNQVLFPIVYSFKNPSRRSYTFFPFFSMGRSFTKDKEHLMITPLAGYFRNGEKTRAFFFPFFNYKKTPERTHTSALIFAFRKTTAPGYSKTSVLWPICENLKTANNHHFRIAPFVWYTKTDTSKMFSVQPFFYSYKSPIKRTFILSWFIYKYENKTGQSISKSFLWRLFHSEKFSNGDFETRFLHLVYANINKEGKTEKSVFPFYHDVKNANGDKSKSVFLSFYNYFKQRIPGLNEFYEEERIFWFVRIRSNYAKLKSEGKEKYLRRR